MAPSCKARFAKNKFSTTVVKLFPFLLIVSKVQWETIFPFRSACWGSKRFPSNSLQLSPNLVEENTSKVALSDSDNVGLVIPKGKLGKVGQGLLVADSNIDKLNGKAGAITPAAAQRMMMLPPLVPEGFC